MASEGAKVVICDVNTEVVNKAVDGIISSGGDAFGIIADVSDSKSVDEAGQKGIDRYGRLDIMVHAAGGSARSKAKHLVDQTDDVISNVIGVNLFGALYCSRAAARNMIANRTGRIINLSSVNGTEGNKGYVEYSASKGGVIAMTKALAKELGEYGITVNSVCPGIVLRPNEQWDVSHTNFMGRKCTADEVAGLIAFLASDEAAFITGQNYIIDGGRSLGLKGTD